MRAIIFGGSGFIGSHMASALAADGISVVLADIEPPRVAGDRISFELCDVRAPIEILGRADDIVYNFAAVHRTPGHPPEEYYQTNVAGAQNITTWCERTGIRTIVFTSSISVYGATENLLDESSPTIPTSDYGRSKLLAERIHSDWRLRGNERRLLTVRPAVVFGPGEHGNFTRLAHAMSKKTFLYPGRRDVIKACGYVDDLVNAIRFVGGLAASQVLFNYCYPDQYTIEQICRAFADVAGFVEPKLLPMPIVRAAMTALHLVNPSDRGTLSKSRVAKLTESTNIAPTALKELGFCWSTDMRTALERWRDADPVGQFV